MTQIELTPEKQFENFIADSRERWKALIGDCPEDDPTRLQSGDVEVAITMLSPEAQPTLRPLRDRIAEISRAMPSGWNLFHDAGNRAKPIGYAIETTYHDRDHIKPRDLRYYWRVCTDGRLYSLRGYKEDNGQNSGLIGVQTPVGCVAASLRFAAALSDLWGDDGELLYSARFTGLRGRRFTHFATSESEDDYPKSVSPEMQLKPLRARKQQIDDNLPDLLYEYLVPMYEQFDFCRLTHDFVANVLEQLT